jgi:hypothetical protein
MDFPKMKLKSTGDNFGMENYQAIKSKKIKLFP